MVQFRVRVGMLLGQRLNDVASDLGGFQWTGPFDQPTFE
jgi:hypothetical protein